MKVKILEYDIYALTKKTLLEKIENTKDKLVIVSGNPEILYRGSSDDSLKDNFSKPYSVIIPDGIGVVLASKIVRQPVKEKIAGIEVMQSILEICNRNAEKVYLLGATDEILEKCKQNIEKQFPKLQICGTHHGFFDMEKCDSIISEIQQQRPYALFVAMGCPRQEKFIYKYLEQLDCTLFMGVGGSFDVMAGKVKRAPRWMISMGLEWLYRVYKEPWRIRRLNSIPKFLLKVIYNTYIIKS